MLSPSGIGTLMTNLRALSSMPRSMSLLWTRISNLSHVAVPFPAGPFLVVSLSLFVGKGIGPRISTPVLSAISFMYWQVWFIFVISMLANFILAFFNYQGMHWLDFHDSRIAVLDKVGLLLQYFSCCRVQLLHQFDELARYLCCVDVEHRRISYCDNSWMVQHHNLRSELCCNCWSIVNMAQDVAPCDILLVQAPHVKADVVARLCLLHLLMVHLNCLDFAGNALALPSR